MYAVIKTGGKQYKVSEGDLLNIEKLEGEKGSEVVFNEVLMLSGGGEDLRIGAPLVDGVQVVGEVLSQTKGPKITIFKMKRRKGFRKKTGHRQPLTNLKIKKISL
jgi:large subunit ribosomal protein L21